VRRILTQAAQAAVKKQGSHFQSVFRRLLPRLGYKGAIWSIAHRLGRLVWKILFWCRASTPIDRGSPAALHDGISYLEQGTETNPRAKKRRAQKLAQALRKLGYNVSLTLIHPESVVDQHG
jgi:hypothetical protein